MNPNPIDTTTSDKHSQQSSSQQHDGTGSGNHSNNNIVYNPAICALVRGIHESGHRDIGKLHLPVVGEHAGTGQGSDAATPSSKLTLPRLIVSNVEPSENLCVVADAAGEFGSRNSNLNSNDETTSMSPGRRFSHFNFAPLRRFSHAHTNSAVLHCPLPICAFAKLCSVRLTL